MTKSESNRANSQHSTGPKTEEGKRISSHNALKVGLTGRTVLLPTDDVAAYQAHLDRLQEKWQPATDEERLLTSTLAQIEWRLLRIPTIETGILALGRKQFAETHADESPETRAVLIEAEVFLAFQKQLANLHLQETRLTRQLDRETARLQELQRTRLDQVKKELTEAATLFLHCHRQSLPFPLEDLLNFGFEFSLEEIQERAAVMEGRQAAGWPTINAYYILQNFRAA